MASSPDSDRTTISAGSSEEKPLKRDVGIGAGNYSEFGSDEDNIDASFEEELSPEVADEILRKLDHYYSLSSNDYEDIVLLEPCDPELFAQVLKWRDRIGRKFRVSLLNGKLMAELPLGPHENACGYFDMMAYRYNDSVGGGRQKPLRVDRSEYYFLDNGIKVEPDAQFRVADRHCPNLVIEVANTDSVAKTHQKAAQYLTLSDNIMMVGVVKIYPNGAMLYLQYSRSLPQPINNIDLIVPDFGVSFGPTPMSSVQVGNVLQATHLELANLRGYFANNQGPNEPCLEPHMPSYQVTYPRHLLLCLDLAGQQVDQRWNQYGDWQLDLFDLQTHILR
jgi:Uma2 family endonuclease